MGRRKYQQRSESCEDNTLDGYEKIITQKIKSCQSQTKVGIISKGIHLPVRDISKTNPVKSDLVVDEKSKYLYYSDGKEWYLNQTVEEPVNIVLQPNSISKCHKTLDEVFRLFKGDPSNTGTVNIKLEPGNYDLTTQDITLGINQLNITGDERDVAGMSYVNGKRANMANREGFGKSKTNTEILFEDPNVVTVNVEDLDLTQIGLVIGDKVKIHTGIRYVVDGNEVQAFYTYTISKIEPNKIYTVEQLSENILNCYENGAFSPSVTFPPNVIINLQQDAVFNTKTYMKGINVSSEIDPKVITFNLDMTVDNTVISTSISTVINASISLNNSTFFISIFQQSISMQSNIIKSLYMNGVYVFTNSGNIFSFCVVDINNSTIIGSEFYNDPRVLDFNDSKGNITGLDQGLNPLFRVEAGVKTFDYRWLGPLFSFYRCDLFIFDIKCENVNNIVESVNSLISIKRVNFKWTLPYPVDTIVLWLIRDRSDIYIQTDTYDFQIFPITTRYFYVFSSYNFSSITSYNRDYSKYPEPTSTYRSFLNSIINNSSTKELAWPGDTLEETGGKIYFATSSLDLNVETVTVNDTEDEIRRIKH